MHESFGSEPSEDERAAQEARQGSADDSKVSEQQSPKANQPASNDAVPKPKPKHAKPRRKRKLTLETQTEICAMISVGCSLRTAARLAGCSEAAIRNLARRDEDFAKRLREASMRREIFPLRNIINASQTRWRAAAWYLARLNPAEYGYRKPDSVTPTMLRQWSTALASAILEAVQDDATVQRLLKVFNRLAPQTDRRHEMQHVTMPPPYDGKSRD